MRVPAKLYVSPALESGLSDGSVEQAQRVAALPGIIGASLVMPDVHVGYGFPIGGVAAFDVKDGIVSPGGIGFDINCLDGGTSILTKDGYTRKIRELTDLNTELDCLDFKRKVKDSALPLALMGRRADKTMYLVRTRAGREIVASADHPLYTNEGMVAVEKLECGHKVAVNPFEGVPYEEPEECVLLTDSDVLDADHPGDKRQMLRTLKRLGLLPLTTTHPAVPALIRLVSYNMGDGNLTATHKTKCATFSGKVEDMRAVQADIRVLGFSPSSIHTRTRSHVIDTMYERVRFDGTENTVAVSANSFVLLLHLLGAPTGNKTKQSYRVPEWIVNGPAWHQRLFIAAYFGAEGTSPTAVTALKHTLAAPCISINKHEPCLESGLEFLNDISSMLARFGIETAPVSASFSYRSELTTTHRARLYVRATPDNLVKFYEHIGYEYNEKKRRLANLAAQYCRLKRSVLAERLVAASTAVTLYKEGWTAETICGLLVTKTVNRRFIERSLWSERKTGVRTPAALGGFASFIENQADLGDTGCVWDEIESVDEIPGYDEEVYDLSMNHASHNYIANSFVVSNCGVRLLLTDLTLERVAPLREELVELLAHDVPAGTRASSIRLEHAQLDEVLKEGSGWALRNGYCEPSDIERTEELGCMAGAESRFVSHHAKDRGVHQLGTLGSGNHFIEVQRVERIMDSAIAEVFGLRKDQIVVLIHCGSRGLGHQVCTDYLRAMEEELPELADELADRNLMYAPLNHELAKRYLGAMAAAANFAWCNRQVITHHTRKALRRLFPGCSVRVLYDVSHNIAKRETHRVDGVETEVLVHRKGATRAFGPGHEAVCAPLRAAGQPVLVPGSMGTASYVLAGLQHSMDETFGSCCHGAGRRWSRSHANQTLTAASVRRSLEEQGIAIRGASAKGVVEEAPEAYKDVDEVIRVVAEEGLAQPVARLTPIGVVKG